MSSNNLWTNRDTHSWQWSQPRKLVRAFTSVFLNFLSILHEKTYFFYFTHPLLQNTHTSLSILHIFSIKYSFFLYFLLFPSLSHLVFSVHTHTQPTTLQQNPATDSPIFHNNNHNNNDSPIFHNNKIRPLIHRSSTTTITTTTTTTMIHQSSTTTKSGHWFTDLLQQQSQQQRHNHNHNNSDPLALHVRSILCHRLRFQMDCWIKEADRRS